MDGLQFHQDRKGFKMKVLVNNLKVVEGNKFSNNWKQPMVMINDLYVGGRLYHDDDWGKYLGKAVDVQVYGKVGASNFQWIKVNV